MYKSRINLDGVNFLLIMLVGWHHYCSIKSMSSLMEFYHGKSIIPKVYFLSILFCTKPYRLSFLFYIRSRSYHLTTNKTLWLAPKPTTRNPTRFHKFRAKKYYSECAVVLDHTQPAFVLMQFFNFCDGFFVFQHCNLLQPAATTKFTRTANRFTRWCTA